MTSDSSALAGALLVVLIVGGIAASEWGAIAQVTARRALQAVMLLALAAATWLSFEVLRPEILGRATLQPGMSLHVDARTRPVSLLATADLPEEESDPVVWNYTVDFEQQGQLVSRREVTLEQGSHAPGPQLPQHAEKRVPVPEGREVDVVVEEVSDPDAGPLSVVIVPMQPSQLAIGGFGLGLVLLGASVDEVARRRSHHALMIAYLVAFGSMVASGVTPNMGVGRVATAAMAALPLGLPAGLVARYVAGVGSQRLRGAPESPRELPERPTRGRNAA